MWQWWTEISDCGWSWVLIIHKWFGIPCGNNELKFQIVAVVRFLLFTNDLAINWQYLLNPPIFALALFRTMLSNLLLSCFLVSRLAPWPIAKEHVRFVSSINVNQIYEGVLNKIGRKKLLDSTSWLGWFICVLFLFFFGGNQQLWGEPPVLIGHCIGISSGSTLYQLDRTSWMLLTKDLPLVKCIQNACDIEWHMFHHVSIVYVLVQAIRCIRYMLPDV